MRELLMFLPSVFKCKNNSHMIFVMLLPKIFLKKGESADVTFDITRSELEYVLADGSVVSDLGEFELFIGGSSADLRPVRFTVLQ